jgi:serine/threonine-protein kinase
LKPENLFFTRDAQVKVLDFGIARVRELGSTTKTQTGSLMGTPSFMSPEQARGRWEEVDAQSDLWALGATMFTLLTGDLVHVAGTVNEALALAVTQPARSLGLVRPELPSSVIAFVDRALAYDKQARWADALAMQTARREAYASLEGEWDERTVLNEAAASLPEAQVAAPTASAAGTTALATSKSAPVLPLPIRNRSMLLIATAVLGLVLLVIVIGSIATTSSSVPAAESSHAAALPPTASQKPRSAALASEAPSLPPLAVEDLPAVESIPPRASVAPSSSRGAVAPGTAAIVRSAQVVAPPSPAPQRAPSRALADPFAGRD